VEQVGFRSLQRKWHRESTGRQSHFGSGSFVRRTPAKINSFNYFVKEIVALPDSRNRAWKKKQLEKIVRRIRDSTVGHADYSAIDFLEDVKCACARDGVRFDDDIFNELVG